jgi:hypothetical protein
MDVNPPHIRFSVGLYHLEVNTSHYQVTLSTDTE